MNYVNQMAHLLSGLCITAQFVVIAVKNTAISVPTQIKKHNKRHKHFTCIVLKYRLKPKVTERYKGYILARNIRDMTQH